MDSGSGNGVTDGVVYGLVPGVTKNVVSNDNATMLYFGLASFEEKPCAIKP